MKKEEQNIHSISGGKGEDQPLKMFHIEGTCQGDRLQISTQERLKGEETTLRPYEEIPVSMKWVKTKCTELVDTLNKANRRGKMPPEILLRLKEIGQVFHDELFSLNVKEKLKMTDAQYLYLNLDEQLVQIPWELFYDGRQFLCRRFNIGRSVKTRQTFSAGQNRNLAFPLKMLILADPQGDLKSAYNEGKAIRDFMDQKSDCVNVTLRSDNITPDSIKEKMRAFDIVHFAGHADYNLQNPAESRWRLSKGNLKAKDIIKMAGTSAMPALIFSNACQSARTEEWTLAEHFQEEIFGLANAFLLTGVKHYLGTFWEILDEPGNRFALEFYKHLLSGSTIGKAVRQARKALSQIYGEESIAWASYVLYGDPTFHYSEQSAGQAPKSKKKHSVIKPTPEIMAGEKTEEIRGSEAVIDFSAKKEKKKSRCRKTIAAVGIASLLAAFFWFYPGFLGKRISEYEQIALASYRTGNYDEALNTCRLLQKKNPRRSFSSIILGNIHFLKSDTKSAQQYFKKALNAEQGSNTEKADALMGLGRIASTENKTDQAMKFYRQAAEFAPEKKQAYISQAILMDNEGNYDEAGKLFDKARALSTDDHLLEAMIIECREKAALANSKEKQERIDKLVRELLDDFHKSVPPPPSDGWTSLPLTLWIMDFTCIGYSLQEGEDRLITSGIIDRFIKKSRVRIVERTILDKLMEELKMGSSKLADQATALALGKMMAARVMLCGKIVYAGPQTQIVFRLIETETSQIKAVVNESFSNPALPSVVAEKLCGILLEKFKDLYPLRGKIDGVKEKELMLNIGQKHGVQIGQLFRVVGTGSIIETITVQPGRSMAIVKKGKGNIHPGLKVIIDG